MRTSGVAQNIIRYLSNELDIHAYYMGDEEVNGLHRMYLPGRSDKVKILDVVTILNYLGQLYDFKYTIRRQVDGRALKGWDIYFYLPIDIDEIEKCFEETEGGWKQNDFI